MTTEITSIDQNDKLHITLKTAKWVWVEFSFKCKEIQFIISIYLIISIDLIISISVCGI